MPIAGVVADANVLLSAIVGKSALRVLTKFAIRVHATQYNADEVKNRDPEDAHVLALAKLQGLPIWSNNRDLAEVTVECFTTARLLRALQDQSQA